ncbi:MAG: hypothetical protein J6S15_08670 [Clostridia bacterium]|nr:hypothetical protein [Clostridia bacterium]
MRKLTLLMVLLMALACFMAACGEEETAPLGDTSSYASESSSDADSGNGSSVTDLPLEGGESSEVPEPEYSADPAPVESHDASAENGWPDESYDSFEESGSDSFDPETSEPEISYPEISGVEGDAMYQDGSGRYTVEYLHLPEFNFGRDIFTVCVTGNEIEGTYYSEEIAPDLYTTTDVRFNEAVRWRNREIYDAYGVEVEAYKVRNVAEQIMVDTVAGTAFYDAAMPFMGQATRLAQEAMLWDLKEFSDYIHLDAPWWDQAANENLSVAGKLFFTTGDISVMQKNISYAILFNKEIYDEVCASKYGSLYDLVRDGKWTFDTMVEMGKLATHDSNFDGVMTYEDCWGMIGTNNIGGFYSATGNKLIAKDQNDIPYVEFGSSETSLTAAEQIVNAFLDHSWFANTHKMPATWPEKNVWEAAMAGFGNDRVLFYYSAFSAIKKLNNYEVRDHMGILPVPKGSEEQESYCTPANVYYAYGICIPVSVEDPVFSAYMIELLACEAKNWITPEYYEGFLKVRDFRDNDSEEMLDNYIFNNVAYDLGVLHNFGGIHSMFDSLVASGSLNVASHFESIAVDVEQKIDDYLSAFYIFD